MRNIILLTFLFLPIIVNTQTILPTFEDSPIWEMMYDNYFSYESYSIELKEDTLICGQLWTPVENTNTDLFIAGRIGYFREEGEKVFVRKTENCDEEVFLMFDFSAEVGDTLIVGWGGGNPLYPYEVVVTGKSVFTVNGVERRIVNVLHDALFTPISFVWVEGVGNIEGHAPPLYSLDCSLFLCSESGYLFNCFYENGNLSFTDPFSVQSCEYLIDTLRVNQNLSTGNNNGTDWENAFFDLQDALEIADSSTVILVAEGTYFPTANDDRTVSFVIPDGVQLYGGFMGNETNIIDRNIEDNPTILSGDIGLLEDKSDNSYHVLYAFDVDSTTIIDGFIIEKGNANGMPFSSDNAKGGGFLINTDFTNPKANPVIKNCIFKDNSGCFGGGIYCKGRHNQSALNNLENCVFSNNFVSKEGGGIYKKGGKVNSFAKVLNCSFIENYAITGGAFHLGNFKGKQLFENCLFEKDSADFEGGALYVINGESNFSLELNKCRIINNKSESGGGVSFTCFEFDPGTQINFIIDSTDFLENSGYLSGGGGLVINTVFGSNLLVSINHTIFEDNTANSGGGGIFIQSQGDIALVVNNSVFANNIVYNNGGCGGIYYAGAGNPDIPFSMNTDIKNTIFNGNSDALGFFTGFGGGINLNATNCTFSDNGDRPFWKNWNPNFTDTYFNNWYISNSIIWEDAPIEFLFFNNNLDNFTINDYFLNNCLVNVPNCIVDGVDACIEGMIYQQDPLFRNPQNNDFQLAGCSSAINAGNNTYLQTEDTLDLSGMPRILENIVDMGAYERDSFTTEILEVIDETCADAMDGEIIVATQSNEPLIFDWQVDSMNGEGLTDLSMGDYFLVISDSLGCADSVNITVGGGIPIEVFGSIEDASAATVEDGAIFIDSIIGGTAPYNLAWEMGNTTLFLEELAIGMYTLMVMDANGCEAEVVFEVSFMSGTIESAIAAFDFKLYPNPIENMLFLEWNEQFKPNNLTIYNVLGKIVYEVEIRNKRSLNLKKLPSGVYFLEIGNAEQRVIQQIIKN